MKLESLLLKLLFAATLIVSAGMLASMLGIPHEAMRLASRTGAATATMGLQHLACPLLADNVICLHAS